MGGQTVSRAACAGATPGDRRWPRVPRSGILFLSLLVGGVGASACKSRPRLTRGDAAVLVTPAVPEPSPNALAEQEPNGEQGRPNSIAWGEAPVLEVSAALPEGDDEDRFLLRIPGGAPLGADAAPATATQQLALEVSAPAPTSLVVKTPVGLSSFASAGAAGVIHGPANLAVAPGSELTLVVRRTGPPATDPGYRVRASLSTIGAGDEREPNHEVAQAHLLSPAHTAPEVAGFLDTAKDVDVFQVPLGPASAATVIAIELEPPPEVAVSVTALDGASMKVGAARGKKGARVLLRQLSPERLGAGPTGVPPAFFVVVRSEGGSDRTRRYLMRVRADDAPPSEREPNDDLNTPSPAEAGETLGYLGGSDVDIFRADGRAGHALQVELLPPKSGDLVLETMAPGQAGFTRTDGGRRGQPERLTVTPATDGPVLIRISAKRVSEGGEQPYRLRLGQPTTDTSSP